MRVALGALPGGQRVRAVFASARYGTFSVEGNVRETLAGDLAVAGHILGGPAKKVLKDGQEIVQRAPTAELRTLGALITDEQGADVAPEAVSHGDLVSVDFNHHVHGPFTVVGVATEGNDPHIVLAQWLIHSRAPATMFPTAIRRVQLAGDHAEVVPSRRSSMDEAVVDPID